MGGTSDNPLALTSGQTIDLIIRNATESGTNYTQYYGRTGDSDGHYLEVTYTVASSGSGLMLGGD
jgi:ribosomal protein L21E